MPARHTRTMSGFTLLEVMIAVAIMVVAFSAILTSQSSAIMLVTKTKELNIAAWLARNKMMESEHLLDGKSFGEMDKEKEEQFPEPFAKYKWKREVREVKFPDLALPKKEDAAGGIPEQARLLVQTLTKYFNDNLRELVVTVSWQRGTGEEKITVATYLVDLTKGFDFSL